MVQHFGAVLLHNNLPLLTVCTEYHTHFHISINFKTFLGIYLSRVKIIIIIRFVEHDRQLTDMPWSSVNTCCCRINQNINVRFDHSKFT